MISSLQECFCGRPANGQTAAALATSTIRPCQVQHQEVMRIAFEPAPTTLSTQLATRSPGTLSQGPRRRGLTRCAFPLRRHRPQAITLQQFRRYGHYPSGSPVLPHQPVPITLACGRSQRAPRQQVPVHLMEHVLLPLSILRRMTTVTPQLRRAQVIDHCQPVAREPTRDPNQSNLSHQW